MKPPTLARLHLGVCLAAALAAGAGSSLRAADSALHFRSGPKQTALVELFTSEGCSSCPPAEAWLNRLGARPGLWSEFVPVALHVNYWDHLGWRDPWAAREFTARQRSYAAAWNSRTIYTPGMVLNGQEWRTWARNDAVPPAAAANAGRLSAQSADGRSWQIEFTPPAPGGNVEVHLALLSRGVASDVRAGENRGRRLKHDFVALGLTTQPMVPAGGLFRAEVSLPPEHASPGGGRAIAVWVTPAGQLAPLQALGGELPPAGP